jgi:hypothetical protein
MAKSSSRRVGPSAVKVKTAVVLSPECFKRLGAACLAESLSQSELVELLINRACSGYIVQVRGSRVIDVRGSLNDRPEVSDSASESAPSAAA